jgi:hypothetical protein
MKPHPELVQYMSWNPFNTLHEFELDFERRIRSDPTWVVYAVLDKSSLVPGQGKTQNLICSRTWYIPFI